MDIEAGADDLEMIHVSILRSVDPMGEVDLEALFEGLLLSPGEVLRNGMMVLSHRGRAEAVSQVMLRRKRICMQDRQAGWLGRYKRFLRHQIFFIITTTIQRQAQYLYNVPQDFIV